MLDSMLLITTDTRKAELSGEELVVSHYFCTI